MSNLVAGQNMPWLEPRVTAYLDHDRAGLFALLLGPGYRVRDAADLVDVRRTSRSGVEWLAGPPEGVTADLTRVDETVDRFLCVATSRPGQPDVAATLRLVAASGDVVADFTVQLPGGAAVVFAEIYRRDHGWKVRAVGQGYAGGLAEACAAHGLDRTDAPAATAPPTPAAAAAEQSVERFLVQTRMILEDASRTTASLRSTEEFAGRRWESDLEEIVADPALRMGQRGDAARREADERRDAMVGEARHRHRRDLDQLTTEIRTLEPTLPAPLAGWDSATWVDWSPSPHVQQGIRIGQLSLADARGFSMPFLLGVPLSRPVWVQIEQGSDAVATDVLRAAAVRLLAATAAARTRVSIIDVGGRHGTLGLPDGLLDRWPATDSSAAAGTLLEVAQHLDLLALAVESGGVDALDERHRADRLLLIADFPTGLDELSLRRLAAIIEQGPRFGVQVMVTGAHAESLDIPLLEDLHRMFLRIPSVPGGDLVDAFGQVDWVFVPDPGPADPALLFGVLDRMAASRAGLGNPAAG